MTSTILTETGSVLLTEDGGSLLVDGQQELAPTALAGTVVLGTPTLTPGTVTVWCGGLGPTATVGSPVVTARSALGVTAVASSVQFGLPVTSQVTTVRPGGLASAVAIGAMTVRSRIVIVVHRWVDQAVVGTPAVVPAIWPITAAAVAPATAFGAATVQLGTPVVRAVGIAPAALFGRPVLRPGAVTIRPTGMLALPWLGRPVVAQTAVTPLLTGSRVAVSAGSALVTGTACYFVTRQVAAGWLVVFASQTDRTYTIDSVEGEHQITLSEPYAGPSAATTRFVLTRPDATAGPPLPWYRAGTVTVSQGSTMVIGAGTGWLASARPGAVFTVDDSRLYEVWAVADDTTLELVKPYAGPSASGVGYALITALASSLTAELAARLASLSRFSQALLEQTAALLAAATARPTDGGSQVADAVVCATTAVPLATVNRPTVDGLQVEFGDLVLLTAQADGRDNGLYVVRDPAAGGWYRAPVMDSSADLAATTWLVRITSGGSQVGRTWMLACDGALVLGRDDLLFREVGTLTATAPIQVSGNNIAIPVAHNGTDGLLAKEDWTAFRNKAEPGGSYTWALPQVFSQRVRFDSDVAVKGGAYYAVLQAAPLAHAVTYSLPSTGQSEATLAVLGTVPTMPDGTYGSRFVGRIGFFGSTPVDQQTAPSTLAETTLDKPSGSQFNALVQRVNLLIARFRAYGLLG